MSQTIWYYAFDRDGQPRRLRQKDGNTVAMLQSASLERPISPELQRDQGGVLYASCGIKLEDRRAVALNLFSLGATAIDASAKGKAVTPLTEPSYRALAEDLLRRAKVPACPPEPIGEFLHAWAEWLPFGIPVFGTTRRYVHSVSEIDASALAFDRSEDRRNHDGVPCLWRFADAYLGVRLP